jgi:hypothetical protein
MKVYNPPRTQAGKIQMHHIKAVFGSIWHIGIRGEGRRHYWKLFLSYLVQSPAKFGRFIVLSIYGYHFYKVATTETW